jgi:hypothetical protein
MCRSTIVASKPAKAVLQIVINMIGRPRRFCCKCCADEWHAGIRRRALEEYRAREATRQMLDEAAE